MRDPFVGYDAWLERPYQDMIADADAFYDWAEANGFDLDDDDDLAEAELAYDEYLDSQYDDYYEDDFYPEDEEDWLE